MEHDTVVLMDRYEKAFDEGPPSGLYPSENQLQDAMKQALDDATPIDPGGQIPEEVRRGDEDV